MFSNLTEGYYVRQMFVVPGEPNQETAKVNRHTYNRAVEEVYNGEEPLIIRLGNYHLTVTGGDNIPDSHLTLPTSVLTSLDIRHPPTVEDVWVLKENKKDKMLQYLQPKKFLFDPSQEPLEK